MAEFPPESPREQARRRMSGPSAVRVGGKGRPKRMPSGRAPFDWRDSKAQGLSGFLAGIGGGLSDLGRGAGNMASDLGDWLGSRPQTTKAGSQVFGADRGGAQREGFNAAGEQARMNNRAAADRLSALGDEEEFGEEDEYQPLSLAEALARAMQMLPGGGGVNYDPQREAARSRASENDARLEAMYRQLQGSYAADAPTIAASYDQATESTNEATDQGVTNINNAYDKARADQTAQLAALGIEDAAAVIAGAGQSATVDQADAVSNLEQNRGANVNELTANKQSAGTYNTRIGQAAGLEGNLQRAVNQSRLQQLLADIDAEEQGQNAQLAGQNRSAAMSLAESLVGESRYNREYADSREDRDFSKQLQVQELAQGLQGQTAARFDPQQAISATDQYFEANGIQPTPDEWNKVFGNMIRNYSTGY